MKLRNKQTRKVYTVRKDIFVSIIDTGKIEVRVMTPDGHVTFFYGSFDEMLNDWEDYKPAEPLIKDKKIRKAVRAWAEAIEANKVVISYSRHDYLKITDEKADSDICFDYELGYTYNEDIYTIEELCGEEEE